MARPGSDQDLFAKNAEVDPDHLDLGTPTSSAQSLRTLGQVCQANPGFDQDLSAKNGDWTLDSWLLGLPVAGWTGFNPWQCAWSVALEEVLGFSSIMLELSQTVRDTNN